MNNKCFSNTECSTCVRREGKTKKPKNIVFMGYFGVPGGIRTHDLPLRRRTLYPAEVRGRINFYALLSNHTLHS